MTTDQRTNHDISNAKWASVALMQVALRPVYIYMCVCVNIGL